MKTFSWLDKGKALDMWERNEADAKDGQWCKHRLNHLEDSVYSQNQKPHVQYDSNVCIFSYGKGKYILEVAISGQWKDDFFLYVIFFFFLSFPNLLQCIYIYIYLYIYAPYYQGKKCSLLPILYTLYHVQRHAFISITFTVLEVSSSILTGYMSKSQFQGLMVQFSGFSTSL